MWPSGRSSFAVVYGLEHWSVAMRRPGSPWGGLQHRPRHGQLASRTRQGILGLKRTVKQRDEENLILREALAISVSSSDGEQRAGVVFPSPDAWRSSHLALEDRSEMRQGGETDLQRDLDQGPMWKAGPVPAR